MYLYTKQQIKTVGLWLWKWRELFSRISVPIFFPVFSYSFLDRFFHRRHADFNGEHLSYLNKTNWPKLGTLKPATTISLPSILQYIIILHEHKHFLGVLFIVFKTKALDKIFQLYSLVWEQKKSMHKKKRTFGRGTIWSQRNYIQFWRLKLCKRIE
jgi:hypothetical protein